LVSGTTRKKNSMPMIPKTPYSQKVPVSVIVLIRVRTVEAMMRSSTQWVMLHVAEPLPRISSGYTSELSSQMQIPRDAANEAM
jgi:hypothetical protein